MFDKESALIFCRALIMVLEMLIKKFDLPITKTYKEVEK